MLRKDHAGGGPNGQSGASDQGDETIETARTAARLRHRGEGSQKILVVRMALAVAAPRLAVRAREADAPGRFK